MTAAPNTAATGHATAQHGTASRGDAALVIAIAAGATPTEAAQRAGVSRRTAYRRLEDPTFRRRITIERDSLVRATIGLLTDASLDAASTLRSIATDPDHPSAVRVSAARAILDVGLRMREQAEIIDRLESLETTLQPSETSPWG